MSKFKFGDMVRHKETGELFLVSDLGEDEGYIVATDQKDAVAWNVKVDELELVPHLDTERLMYLVEKEKLVLLDDDGAWSVVNAIPEYYESNRRLSREFDFRHAIDKAMEMEKENDTRPSTKRN